MNKPWESSHSNLIPLLTRYKNRFVVGGRVAGPSNDVYRAISRELNRVMSAKAVYSYIKKHKDARKMHKKWGISEETKENVEPPSDLGRKPKNKENEDGKPTTSTAAPVTRSRKQAQQIEQLSDAAGELRLDDEMKFMENFDPEKSKREQRKLSRKISNACKKSTLYDERGIHIKSGRDLCDCLNDKCHGCFFACPKCRSFKCGQECRLGRRWMYESIQDQVSGEVFTSKYYDH